MEDKIIDIREQKLAIKITEKISGVFDCIDAELNSQADALIQLAVQGSLSDFIVMRPINPSVVQVIILKLIK